MAHLTGLYIFLLIFSISQISNLGDAFKSPLTAWMMLPIGFLFSLPFVMPLAIPSVLLVQKRAPRSIFPFVIAGAICGACAVSLMQYVLHNALFSGSEFRLALGASISGGIAAGWVYGFYSRSKSGAIFSQKP